MKEIIQTEESKENNVKAETKDVNSFVGKKVNSKAKKVNDRKIAKFKTVSVKKALQELPELKELFSCKDFSVTRLEIKIKVNGKEISSILKLSGTKDQGFIDADI